MPTATRVLALEPYYGGSHKAFLDQWRDHSRHSFEVLGLPAHSWKWRMRHSAVDFARTLDSLSEIDAETLEAIDVILCSDMLNLAEFRGLLSARPRTAPLASLPTVVYFHENQLTYPTRQQDLRDYHFGFTNLTTAWSADEVWFNSFFHRDDFLTAAKSFLSRAPSKVGGLLEDVEARSHVVYPGVDQELFVRRRAPTVDGDSPLHIAWAARWEHDKGFADFSKALEALPDGLDFELSILGESFREVPPAFERTRSRFSDRIRVWGYQESPEEYAAALGAADVLVSTAQHEFFGLAVVEGMALGVVPVLPARLSYPELLRGSVLDEVRSKMLYDGSSEGLCRSLCELYELKRNDPAGFDDLSSKVRLCASDFSWSVSGRRLDEGIDRLVKSPKATAAKT